MLVNAITSLTTASSLLQIYCGEQLAIHETNILLSFTQNESTFTQVLMHETKTVLLRIRLF